jgi:hypothetical protein
LPTWLRRAPSLNAVVGAVVGFVALLVGLGPLNDNSFFTHLATGRLMWDTHHIPHTDPYSFTAAGKPWVVQSWLASFLYGGADNWWGPAGLLVLIAITAAIVGLLVWTLTRPSGSLLARLLIVFPVLVVGVDAGWVERPLLFGLVSLGVVLLAAEGRVDPRWLVPTMWFWVNVHGSFPLGLVALGLFALGTQLDGRSPSVELRALQWAGIGTLLGGINALGPRLLVFPIELLRRQNVLSNVLEWQAPQFTRIGQRLFLVEVVAAIILVARRPSWRTALPLAVFTAAALLGARNVVVASIVIVPGLAACAAGLGSISGEDRRPIFRPALAAIVVVGLLSTVVAASGSVYNLNGYPVAAVTWAERNNVLDAGARIVSRDFVGNYLEVRYGTRVKVFLDDRYDMFPATVVDDFAELSDGHAGWDRVLDRYQPTAVIWPSNEALAQLLAASPLWKVLYTDQEFLIAAPR